MSDLDAVFALERALGEKHRTISELRTENARLSEALMRRGGDVDVLTAKRDQLLRDLEKLAWSMLDDRACPVAHIRALRKLVDECSPSGPPAAPAQEPPR